MGLACTHKFIKCTETEQFTCINMSKYGCYIIDKQRYRIFGMYLAVWGDENQINHF